MRMKKPSVQLSIQQPCAENWNEMTPVDQGKFCQLCSKQVIDFTQLSDEQLLRVIENNGEKLCGRFKSNQLNRPIVPINYKQNNYSFPKIFSSLLVLTTLHVFKASGKQTNKSSLIHLSDAKNSSVKPETKLQLADSSDYTIEGIVTEKESGEIVYYAKIVLKGSKIGTYSDLDGKFKLTIPKTQINDTMEFLVSSFDYSDTINLKISKEQLPLANLQIKFNSFRSDGITMGIIVVEKRKWWQFRRRRN